MENELKQRLTQLTQKLNVHYATRKCYQINEAYTDWLEANIIDIQQKLIQLKNIETLKKVG